MMVSMVLKGLILNYERLNLLSKPFCQHHLPYLPIVWKTERETSMTEGIKDKVGTKSGLPEDWKIESERLPWRRKTSETRES